MEQNITTETTLGFSIDVHKLLYIFYHELMAINNCSKVLWTASGLTIQDLLYLQQQKASTASNKVSKCRIDVDVLIIMASSEKNYRDSLLHTATFLKSISHTCGFIVTVVLDGDHRPDCKRDSWNRRRNATIAKIDAFVCRQNAITLAALCGTDAATNKYRKRLCLFNSAAKTLENSSQKMNIPPHFKQDLEERLMMLGACDAHPVSGGHVVPDIVQAKFQADSLLAYRHNNKAFRLHLVF